MTTATATPPIGQKQTVISTAAMEYANRPPDERYPSLDALCTAATTIKDQSKEAVVNVKDLKVTTLDPAAMQGLVLPKHLNLPEVRRGNHNGLALISPKGMPATFTHWSFGQFCRSVGAPATFLRDDLSADLTRDVLNYRIGQTSSDINLLVQWTPQLPKVRAATSDSYGRVWDGNLYPALRDQLFAHRTPQGDSWKLPPVWGKPGDTAGAFMGDRDSFLIMIDGGSIVNNPSHDIRDTRRPMYRGVMVRNSDVGLTSVLIECVLFDYICGNLNLWGALIDRRFRRRHVGKSVLRDTIREIGMIAKQWTTRTAAQDEAIIKGLMEHQIATSREAVIDELRKMGMTKDDANSAYDACEQYESASPFSYWGIANGVTRMSQLTDYRSDRQDLDQLASAILQRGRKLVAA